MRAGAENAGAPSVEFIRVSDELALVRAEAPGGMPAAAPDLLALDPGRGPRQFQALPDPVLGELGRAGAWRAAWAIPLDLIDREVPLGLETPAGPLMLAQPLERRLTQPCRRELEVRGGRPYLRFVVGIVTAALVPVSLPTSSFARDLPPCPAPLVRGPAPGPGAPAPPAEPGVPEGCVPASPQPAPEVKPKSEKPSPPPAAPKPAAAPKPPTPAAVPPSRSDRAKPPESPSTHKRSHAPRPHPHRTAPKRDRHSAAAHPKAPRHPARHRAESPQPTAPRADAPVRSRSVAPEAARAAAAAVRAVTLDSWGVPTELLPIYQAAGNAYGVPWTVLASINKIETAYGHNLNVSSAGALGWMQFMPATWSAYGVDAGGDGVGDPFDPADAIFAAARYLSAAGGSHDIRRAVFAYNHADWYVDSVMKEAASLETVPQPAVDAIVAVMRGSGPVSGRFRVSSRPGHSRSVLVSADSALPLVAPADGRVVALGHSRERGRYVTIEDPFGNRYSFAGLGTVARGYPVPGRAGAAASGRAPSAGDARQALRLLGLRAGEAHFARLRVGARVVAGTMLGRLRNGSSGRASTVFSIRSAGRLIDPAPVLHAWQAAAKIPAAPTGTPAPSAIPDAPAAVGAALLLNKTRLVKRVLADTRLELSTADRRAIQTGQVDARVLDTLELLADARMHPTVASVRGAAVDISAIAGVGLSRDGEGAAAAKRLTDRLESLQGTLRPDRIVRGASQVRIAFAGSVRAIGQAANVQAAANRLDRLDVPYVWGGGHVSPTPAVPTGLDCSSSVSWVLQRAGLSLPTMTSGEFASYGDAGAGRYVTIYANDTHVFMSIGGRFFGTSGFGHPDAGTGPHWFVRQPSASYLAGFTQRHPHGL